MISELKIRNFKSLESVDLKLGHFNLLVGANASGKSNFLDALRFLQGVSSSGLSIDEIFERKATIKHKREMAGNSRRGKIRSIPKTRRDTGGKY